MKIHPDYKNWKADENELELRSELVKKVRINGEPIKEYMAMKIISTFNDHHLEAKIDDYEVPIRYFLEHMEKISFGNFRKEKIQEIPGALKDAGYVEKLDYNSNPTMMYLYEDFKKKLRECIPHSS